MPPRRLLQELSLYIGHPQYLGDFSRNIGFKWVPHGFSGFLVQNIDSNDTKVTSLGNKGVH